MKTYGKIDAFGVLTTVVLESEDQLQEAIENDWFPCEEFDTSKIENKGEGIRAKVKPILKEGRIVYDIQYVRDKQFYQKKIEQLKKQLSDDDYKVRKCYEYFLVSKELPYNIQEIHANAEIWRTEINQLEKLLDDF